jgi:nitrous oxide reductase accessory protein NosL
MYTFVVKQIKIAFLLVAMAALLGPGCSRSGADKACVVCQREMCCGMGAKVELRSGKSLHCCCAKCAFAYAKTAGNDVAAVAVQDWASGNEINAKNSIFVQGSDVNHCATAKPERLPQGGVAMACYDRCQPGLLAFADRKAAENFTAQHGGKVIESAAAVSQ